MALKRGKEKKIIKKYINFILHEKMKKIVTLACAAVAGITAATAQTESNQWAVGVYGGLTEYEGELASNMMGILKDNYSFYGHGGFSVNRFLNKRWDVAFFGSYGLLGAKKEGIEFDNEDSKGSLVLGTNSSNNPEMKLTEVYGDLTAAFKFVTKDSCRFSPYIFAGAGYRYLMVKDANKYIGQSFSGFSESDLKPADYLKLDLVSISYRIPLNVKWLKTLRVHLTGKDLLMTSKYDGWNPLVNSFADRGSMFGVDYGAYPMARSIILGLNLLF